MRMLIIVLLSFHGVGLISAFPMYNVTGNKSMQHDQVLWCPTVSSRPPGESDVLNEILQIMLRAYQRTCSVAKASRVHTKSYI